MKKKALFLETLCFENGHYPLLPWHQCRVEETFRVYFPDKPPLQLGRLLPKLDFAEPYKVRVVYDGEQSDVEFSPYSVRTIRAVQLVSHSTISYRYKWADRRNLERLFALRGQADDILIVRKGKITDSFYANVAFWDGSTWYTPTTCLLNGVRRQSLLESGKIKACRITVSDLPAFQKVSFINAMLDLGTSELPVSNLSYDQPG